MQLLMTERIDVCNVLLFSLHLYVLNVKSDYCEHVLMNFTGLLLVLLTSDWNCPAPSGLYQILSSGDQVRFCL